MQFCAISGGHCQELDGQRAAGISGSGVGATGLRSSGGWNVQGTTCLLASRAGSLVAAQVCRGLAREWPSADCFISKAAGSIVFAARRWFGQSPERSFVDSVEVCTDQSPGRQHRQRSEL
jgi:hypothetical protein